jgi:3-(3-hydroxy-phenyl)propionate hydroxylase
MVGAEFTGQVFEDQFLIADVKMTAEFPTERWFWFDPPFHAGRSALLHKQPDDIWRIDLQLNRYVDPAFEKLPENVRPRIARMLAHDKFEFEWISLYKFQCRRMDRFIHGHVIFAGDAAHQVSPFGARGANSGLEDAENLAWKLDRVLRGTSPESLLESYHVERSAAADENIRESTRSTDFMAPNSHHEARLRKAVLSLAKETEFGKRMVNAGRLSVPSIYATPLSTQDDEAWRGGPGPGTSMFDAPIATPSGDRGYLTDAFIEAGTSFLSIPTGWPLRATMPNPAPPICCGPTVMSPRVSGTRPVRRLKQRWRALPVSTEVFDHGIIDQFEFCKTGRRVSCGRRGASRIE